MTKVKYFLVLLLLSLPAFPATQGEAEGWYGSLINLPSAKQSLSAEERQAIFDEASRHKVAKLSALEKYDPTGQIGFCFGRAMTTHLMARRHGLAESSIRKLFVIGDLRSGNDPEWRFHVTTLVKGDEGGWFAIDPIMDFPVANGTSQRMEEWIEVVKDVWDRPKRAKFYQVHPKTILPDIREVPDVAQETGRFIIELKFNPTKEKGFALEDVKGHSFFVPSESTEMDYFMQVGEGQADTFLFEALTINGTVFHYNNYFFDLLRDLAGMSF